MGKKGLGIVTTLIIAAIIGGWLFFQENSKYLGTSAYSAVPLQSPLVLEVRNVLSFSSELEQSRMWKEFGTIPGGNVLYNDVHFVDSLMQHIPMLQSLFQDKSIVMALDLQKDGGISQLNLIELTDVSEKSQIMKVMRFVSSAEDLDLKRRKYANSAIFDVALKSGKKRKFSFAIHHGVLLFSLNKRSIERGIQQLNSTSLLENADFQKVYKTRDVNADVSCYVNHSTFSRFISLPFKGLLASKLQRIDDYATWSELDLSIKQSSGTLSGFSFSSAEEANIIDLFHNQTPSSFSLPSVIPNTVTLASIFNISDPESFLEARSNYLKKSNRFKAYQNLVTETTKRLGVNPLHFIKEHINGEIGLVYTENGNELKDRYLVFEVKSASKAKSFIERLRPSSRRSSEPLRFAIDQETEFQIEYLDIPELSEIILGKFYANIDPKYYTFYNNHLVFGETAESIKTFLFANVRGETMDSDVQFKGFLSNISEQGIYMLYMKPSELLTPFYNSIQGKLVVKLLEKQSTLSKFNAIGWLMIPESNMLYNVGYFEFDPDKKIQPKESWKSRLVSDLIIKPHIVMNHTDRVNKELFLQDKNNSIYLLNNKGMVKWNMPLKEKIIGSVRQIDVYKNNKYQYIFNTESALHIIDRNGNYVENFPLKLRAKATCGMSVFDYEKNKNYRLFIPCEDRKVYCYDKNGRTVTGWRFGKTENTVSSPVQHFSVSNKDYIVFHDQYKSYILDRKGSVRVKSKGDFEFSNNGFALMKAGEGNANHLITSLHNGDVAQFYFNGDTKQVNLPKRNSSHYFIAEDINGDGNSDYLFVQDNKLEVVENDGTVLMSKLFKNNIQSPPNIYKFSANNVKIGVVDSESNEIHLLNRNGSEYNGFPLPGQSSFSIGFLNKHSKQFSLLVGGENHFLYHYILR